MERYVHEATAEEIKTFVIDNDKAADWAIRRIKEESAERDRLVSLANEQIADLKRMAEDADRRLENNTSFLKSALRGYFETVDHKETKTQESYRLLSGTLILKKASVGYEHDDDALVSYLEKNNDTELVKVKKSPDWMEFKKRISCIDGKAIDTLTGEVVEAVRVVNRPESFEVKI